MYMCQSAVCNPVWWAFQATPRSFFQAPSYIILGNNKSNENGGKKNILPYIPKMNPCGNGEARTSNLNLAFKIAYKPSWNGILETVMD